MMNLKQMLGLRTLQFILLRPRGESHLRPDSSVQKIRFIHTYLRDVLLWLISCREKVICIGSVCCFSALKTMIEDRDTFLMVANDKGSEYPNTTLQAKPYPGLLRKKNTQTCPCFTWSTPWNWNIPSRLPVFTKPPHWRKQPFWPYRIIES